MSKTEIVDTISLTEFIKLLIPYYGYYILWQHPNNKTYSKVKKFIVLLENFSYFGIGTGVGIKLGVVDVDLYILFKFLISIWVVITLLEALIFKVNPEFLSLGDVKKEDISKVSFTQCLLGVGIVAYHVFYFFLSGLVMGIEVIK